MKKLLFPVYLIVLLSAIFGCSDDFLQKNNRNSYVLSDTIYIDNSTTFFTQTLQVPILAKAHYSILMQPSWLILSSNQGTISNGQFPFTCRINTGELPSTYAMFFGQVVLFIEEVGTLTINVAYGNYGSSEFTCSTASVVFQAREYKTFRIGNNGDGVINWHIEDLPVWLRISETSGSLKSGDSIILTLWLDEAYNNTIADLECIFQIVTDSPSGRFGMAVYVTANPVIPIDVNRIYGSVTDAEFCHETGLMLISTVSPNTLVLINTVTKKDTVVALGKSPNCISMSADGHTALIGYSVSAIDYFDLDNLNVIQNYTIDCIPADLALGENGWCYITPTYDQWVHFRSLNLNTGELHLSAYSAAIFEKSIIKKIPDKPYLAASMPLSPSNLIIFKTEYGAASDTVTTYFADIGKFWFSKDGSKVFAASRYVFHLPDFDGLYHPNNPAIFGNIAEDNYISALDDCPSVNSVFATSILDDYYEFIDQYINQYNSDNFNKIKSYPISPVTITENDVTKFYKTVARYMFVNKEGSAIYVLKNLKAEYGRVFWSMEEIPIVTSG
jgi:hypothetical protein